MRDARFPADSPFPDNFQIIAHEMHLAYFIETCIPLFASFKSNHGLSRQLQNKSIASATSRRVFPSVKDTHVLLFHDFPTHRKNARVRME